MVPGSDPVESLFHAVRDALSPLESGIARAAKDLESQWSKSRNEGKDMNLFGKLAAAKKKPGCYDVIAAAAPEGKKKGTVRIPIKSFIGSLLPDSSLRSSGKDESCTNCLHFAVTWSLLFTNFLQGLPSPFKSVKKCFGKPRGQEDGSGIAIEPMHCKSSKRGYENSVSSCKREPSFEGDVLSLELILCCAFDSVLQNLHLFDLGHKESSSKGCDSDASPPRFDHMKIITGILKGKKADADGFLSNIRFARVGGVPPSLAGTMDSVDGEAGEDPPATGGEKEVSDDSVPQKIASGLLNIPLSNVERLRSTLSTVSLTELIKFIPQLGKSFSEQPEHPDKKKLFSVQNFFRYAETEAWRALYTLVSNGCRGTRTRRSMI